MRTPCVCCNTARTAVVSKKIHALILVAKASCLAWRLLLKKLTEVKSQQRICTQLTLKSRCGVLYSFDNNYNWVLNFLTHAFTLMHRPFRLSHPSTFHSSLLSLSSHNCREWDCFNTFSPSKNTLKKEVIFLLGIVSYLTFFTLW